MEEDNYFKNAAKEIACELSSINKEWNGKHAILDMKNSGYNQWRQMEWIGWYFQFLCEKKLDKIMKIPGKEYGNVKFDGFKIIPWDFKCHIENDYKGKEKTELIINDRAAIDKAIEDYGSVGLVIGTGNAKYNDEDRTFQNWVEELKGGKSNYEKERIERGASSRLRKVSFNLKEIVFVKISKDNLKYLGTYNQGRNSNGNPREPKYELDLKNLDKFEHYSYSKFC